MKLLWKQITIAGFAVKVPVLSRLPVTLKERELEIFKKHRAEMANCERCKKLFSIRASTSFMMHLLDDHHFDFDETCAIIEELYRSLLARKEASHGTQGDKTSIRA